MKGIFMFLAKAKVAKPEYVVLGLLLLLTVAIRLPVMMEPWGGDQAGFGHVAKGILEGNAPYKDFYSLTGYGIFFTFALFFKIFGTTMVSSHIGHLLFSLATVIVLYFFTRYLYGKKPAFVAGLCYAIFASGQAFSGFGYENKSAWGTYWYLSQREVFMAPLMMGAVFLALLGEKKNRNLLYLVSGILLGLAAFYKITAVLMLFLVIGFVASDAAIRKREKGSIKVIGRIISVVSGFIIIQLPFIYYFWIHDALKAVYQALFVHLPVYAKLSRGLRVEAFFSGHYSVLSENLVLWLFAALSCLYIFSKARTRNNVLIAFWAIMSLIMVWVQGKFFGYHFILLVPPFSMLAGYGLFRFLKEGDGIKGFIHNNIKDMSRAFMLTAILLSIIGFGVANYDYYKWHMQYALKKISKSEYYSVFSEFPTHPYSFHSDHQIVQYLNNKREPGDKLGVIFSAGDTVIHFLTGLEPATRFIQSWYLFSSADLLAKNDITLNLRREFIDQLIHVEPRYILCVHIPFEELVELPGLRNDPDIERLESFIATHYRLRFFPDNRFLFERK
jgi:hypothetical protein